MEMLMKHITKSKIKVYITGCGKTKEAAQELADNLGEAMKKLLGL